MGRPWKGFQALLAKKRIEEGCVCAERDERPTTRLEHVLGGKEFVPLLPFPSDQSSTSLMWTTQVPSSPLTGLLAAGKLCSERLQWRISSHWHQESHALPRQRALHLVAQHSEQACGLRSGRRKSFRRSAEALIRRRKRFQQGNRHYLLFLHYENKAWWAWCTGEKMGFVIQMTCILQLALTVTTCEWQRGCCSSNIPCVSLHFAGSLAARLERCDGFWPMEYGRSWWVSLSAWGG